MQGRPGKSEEARGAEEGQMEQAIWGWRDGRSLGVEEQELVVAVGRGFQS